MCFALVFGSGFILRVGGQIGDHGNFSLQSICFIWRFGVFFGYFWGSGMGVCFGLIWLYGISTIVGYLMPNPIYT